MIKAEKDEAILLFKKWGSEAILSRCDFRFALFSVSLRGRFSEVSDHQIRLIADDTLSEMVLRLYDDWQYFFGDTHDVPGAIERYDSVLVLFPASADPNNPDSGRVVFATIREASV
jgi:hypothetical protein